MQPIRHYSLLDKFCLGLDQAIRALSDTAFTTGAPYPAEKIPQANLSAQEAKEAAALMRINHAGEICAQGLYHGQGMVSRSLEVKTKMAHAAIEEGDHLVWCKRRLDELGSHTSYANSLWYTGSFMIGIAAGLMSDAWSLGFVVETEKQVLTHLEKHLARLPAEDQRSRQILTKMAADEAHHRDEALALGARELPWMIQKTMAFTSKIMVKTAYWI